MAKVQFSDVTPPEKRSIRNIPIPNGGRRKSPVIITQKKPPVLKKERVEDVVPAYEPEEVVAKETPKPYGYYNPQKKQPQYSEVENFEPKNKSNKRRFVFGGIAVLVCIIFIISMMTVFASATIDVIPKSQDLDVSLDITAVNDVSTATSSVRYEIIKLSKTKSASLPATGKESVEVKARGKVVIYNNFSTEPQRLITRTRLESPQGLIYRIPESITVPGKTVKNGVETPGSIEVEITADEAGEKYNLKKTDFTVPGFKSDAERYKGFYARSSTDMAGGFVGERKTVEATAKQTALQSMDAEIESDLEKELASKVPDGLALLPGAIIYASSELPQKEDSSSVTIEKEVTAYAIMLNRQDLSNIIVSEYVANSPDWSGITASINDFSGLSVVKKPENINSGEKIGLSLRGKAKTWAEVDPSKISERVAGISRKDTPKLIDEFAGISSIKVTIRPIWKQSFPADSSKIHVKTLTSQQP